MAADLNTRLEEAKAAYHQLMLGQNIVSLRDSNGEQVQYNQVSMGRLAAYIAQLEMQLGIASTTGPARVWFFQ